MYYINMVNIALRRFQVSLSVTTDLSQLQQLRRDKTLLKIHGDKDYLFCGLMNDYQRHLSHQTPLKSNWIACMVLKSRSRWSMFFTLSYLLVMYHKFLVS